MVYAKMNEYRPYCPVCEELPTEEYLSSCDLNFNGAGLIEVSVSCPGSDCDEEYTAEYSFAEIR